MVKSSGCSTPNAVKRSHVIEHRYAGRPTCIAAACIPAGAAVNFGVTGKARDVLTDNIAAVRPHGGRLNFEQKTAVWSLQMRPIS